VLRTWFGEVAGRVQAGTRHRSRRNHRTLPLCIWDFEKKLKKGDNLIFTAFGAGFAWGAVYVKWGYDPKEVNILLSQVVSGDNSFTGIRHIRYGILEHRAAFLINIMHDDDPMNNRKEDIRNLPLLYAEKAALYHPFSTPKQLMQRTKSRPDDIDLVIVATTTSDYRFPSTASILSREEY